MNYQIAVTLPGHTDFVHPYVVTAVDSVRGLSMTLNITAVNIFIPPDGSPTKCKYFIKVSLSSEDYCIGDLSSSSGDLQIIDNYGRLVFYDYPHKDIQLYIKTARLLEATELE